MTTLEMLLDTKCTNSNDDIMSSQLISDLWSLADHLSKSQTEEGGLAYQLLTQILFRHDVPYIRDIKGGPHESIESD